MFAIVETGGKQYKITEGDVLKVEKLPKPENGKIIFDKVWSKDSNRRALLGGGDSYC